MDSVSLRKITLEDTDNILKWRNSENVKKHFCIQNDITREEHINWFNNNVIPGKVEQFIIINNELKLDVGSIYLRNIDKINKKAELGIFIGEVVACGKGIGSESIKQMVRYAFESLKLHKVFLRVFSNNEIAIKAYEKSGFKCEGTAKDDVLLPNGKYQDIIFMSIINKMEEK